MRHPSLFEPHTAGSIDLMHRVVLAPMTRTRATYEALAPDALTVEYHRQCASRGGLLITEATHISPEGTPVWRIYQAVRERGGHVPGIWTDEQALRWRDVTEAVHGAGSKISCLLLHAGRAAPPGIGEHPLVHGTGVPLPPGSSSAVPLPTSRTGRGDYDWDQPAALARAWEPAEMERIRSDYQHAATNALVAGFDGVELRAGHGYLVDPFLCDGVNKRTDCDGGPVSKRCRLLFELVEALIEVVGPGRVGVRLSPLYSEPDGASQQSYVGATCSDPDTVHGHAIRGLNEMLLAYLLLIEQRVCGLSADPEQERAYEHPLGNSRFRHLHAGSLIGAGAFRCRHRSGCGRGGTYDTIAFGRWFLSNPDLPDRIRTGRDLNVYDRSTLYGQGAAGYVDYPAWGAVHGDLPPRHRLMNRGRLRCTLRTAVRSTATVMSNRRPVQLPPPMTDRMSRNLIAAGRRHTKSWRPR